MLKLNAAAFYQATTSMVAIRMLTETRHGESQDGSGTFPPAVEPFLVSDYVAHAKDLQSSLLVLGTRITSMEVHRLLKRLQSGQPMPYADVANSYKEIDSRLQDELSLVRAFVLEPAEQAYFEPLSPLFGADFEAKFSSALFDLDEAAKCRALGRPTACVFHLMRLTEIGLKAGAACLGITLPAAGAARNWGIVLKSIKDAIDVRNSAKPPPWHGADRQFFESTYASLDAVRVAWRNTTMHVENKYTDAEAEHLFVAVKGLMTKLASRMDEGGLPLA